VSLLLQIPLPNSPPWYSLFGATESNIHIVCRSILKLYTRRKVNIITLALVLINVLAEFFAMLL